MHTLRLHLHTHVHTHAHRLIYTHRAFPCSSPLTKFLSEVVSLCGFWISASAFKGTNDLICFSSSQVPYQVSSNLRCHWWQDSPLVCMPLRKKSYLQDSRDFKLYPDFKDVYIWHKLISRLSEWHMVVELWREPSCNVLMIPRVECQAYLQVGGERGWVSWYFCCQMNHTHEVSCLSHG